MTYITESVKGNINKGCSWHLSLIWCQTAKFLKIESTTSLSSFGGIPLKLHNLNHNFCLKLAVNLSCYQFTKWTVSCKTTKKIENALSLLDRCLWNSSKWRLWQLPIYTVFHFLDHCLPIMSDDSCRYCLRHVGINYWDTIDILLGGHWVWGIYL